VKYVPIETKTRIGKSKIKLLQDGSRFFLIITKVATLFSPLRIFLPVSFFFFLIGIFYYIFTYFTEGRFTNMGGLLFSVSVLVFLIGLVSEQITQMRYDRVE
ncbi:MAG: glycosyl transferase, partial [Gammaproteobacteria bacterium]